MHRILLLVAGLCLYTALLACDVCGTYLGVQPNERNHTIGLSYRLRYLEGRYAPLPPPSRTKHGGSETYGVPTHRIETYQAVELRADLRLAERWRLLAIVPVLENYASVNGRVEADLRGLADPSFTLRWLALNTGADGKKDAWRHRLLLGAGPKLPLGNARRYHADQRVDADLQPGSGTWDAIGSVEYLMRKNAWGGSFSTVARLNTQDKEGRRGGHGFNWVVEGFRLQERDAYSWMPSLGVYVEHMAKDRYYGVGDQGTGGTTWFTQAALRAWVGRLGLQAAWQQVFWIDQGADMMPNRTRVLCGIHWNLDRG